MTARPDVSDVDPYLAALPASQRAALLHVRERVRRILPDAEEVISYAIPGFRVEGRVVLWMSAWKTHLSLFPPTYHFSPEKLPSDAFLRKYIAASMRAHPPPGARSASRKAPKKRAKKSATKPVEKSLGLKPAAKKRASSR